MIDKPNIEDVDIIKVIENNYEISVKILSSLPLGADPNTAVYSTDAKDGSRFFVKLRTSEFDEVSLLVPELLKQEGLASVLPPIPTLNGKLWVKESGYFLTVYPFIGGQNGHDAGLGENHLIRLGEALHKVHSNGISNELNIPKESFSPEWRDRVKGFLRDFPQRSYEEDVSSAFIKLIERHHGDVVRLVDSAEQLAQTVQRKNLPFVLCHADIHAWNVLIQDDGRLFVVDWDTVLLAPKERDLMFVAGGLLSNTHTPECEEKLFYRGYGDDYKPDKDALAYYRCERVVQDIAEYYHLILESDSSLEARQEGLEQLAKQFEPGQVVELALKSLKSDG